MNITPEDIKAIFIHELEKDGHTIEEFEEALVTLNTKEGVEKLAELMVGPIEKDASSGAGLGLGVALNPVTLAVTAGKLFSAGAHTAAAVGGAGGMGAYLGAKQMDKEDKRDEELQTEKQHIRDATEALKHGKD